MIFPLKVLFNYRGFPHDFMGVSQLAMDTALTVSLGDPACCRLLENLEASAQQVA